MRLLSRLFSAQKWTLSLYFSDDADENNSSVQENVNLNIYNSRASERTESPRRRDTNKKPVGNEQCFNERCPQGRRPCSRSNSPTPAGPWVWSRTFCTLVFCCPASCPSASRRVDLQDGERGERIQHRFTAPPWPSHTEHSLHKPWWIFHNDAAKQPPDTPWMFPLSSSSDQTQTQGGAGGKRLPPEPPQAWSYREELQLPQSLICQLVLQSDMMESFKVSSSRKVWWWALSLSLSIWSTADKWLTYRLRYWLTWTQTHTLVSSHIILLITNCLLFLSFCWSSTEFWCELPSLGDAVLKARFFLHREMLGHPTEVIVTPESTTTMNDH